MVETLKSSTVSLDVPVWHSGVLRRFIEIADKLLLQSKVGPFERQVAKGVLSMLSKNAKDEDAVRAIVVIQAELLPYILTGKVNGSDPD